jgi:hypothetical protein
MKRWWITTRQSATARVTRRRVGRTLMRVVTIGALSLPMARPSTTVTLPDGTSVFVPILSRLPRTGGAAVQAWAFGTLSKATQPGSQKECDLDHVCELVISSAGGAGTGTGTTIKTSLETSSQLDPSPNLPFTLAETIDYAHPVTKGVKGDNGPGACYPVSGVMAIELTPSSVLALDIVGQACQVGSSAARLVFTGTYATDAASTGTFANADGIGSININNPSGLSAAESYTPAADTTWTKASLVGQLHYGN